MPSSKTWKAPLWLPFLVIAIAVVTIIICCMHLKSRLTARWPW